MSLIARIAGVGALLAGPAAHADSWLVAETPAALAVSDAQAGVFRPGVMPAVGAYADNGRVAVGLRLRAGVLRNGPDPGNNLDDPGLGGLATGTMAVRGLWRGGWVEVAGGGGLTGRDLVPTLELGVGWSFAVRKLDVGPSIRYVRVISHDQMDAFGTAELVLAGVDVRFGKPRSARPLAIERPAPVAVAVAAPPPLDRDDDDVVEQEESCASLAPGALDGCPLAEDLTIENDRIILDERVLFALNKARVRSRGREVIAKIAALWQVHPEWTRITIEGHTCNLGSDEFNQSLSQLRAERARAVLLKHGFTADRIDAIGYGRTRPRTEVTTEDGRQRNRRVEFVIERAPDGGAP